MMKKFIWICGLIMTMALGSCSNEEPAQTPNNPEMESALLNNLKSFNDSLLSIQSSEGRGWITTTLRIVDIVASDALGALGGIEIGGKIGGIFGPHGATIGAGIGGLICGVGASYERYDHYYPSRFDDIISPQFVIAAYVLTKESDVELNQYYPSQINLKLPNDKVQLQDMGAYHNLVLKNLIEGKLSSTPAAEVLTVTEISIIESSDFESQYYSALQIISNTDYDVILKTGTRNNVMKLYLEAMNKCVQKASDLELISNEYVTQISYSSELIEGDKDMLYSAISVAVSSYEFWEDERNYVF